MESDERVEVCVVVTQPDVDIQVNSVNVEVYVDDDSIYTYISNNTPRASKLNNNINFMFIIMLPGSNNTISLH